MKRLLPWLAILLPFTLWAQLFDQYNHPELVWRSFDTEHFTVHYHQGTELTAFRAAKIIEEIYPAVTATYDYQPADRLHLILKDTDDYSNGGAFFFNNKIEIWANNLDYVMRGTKNWLRDVLTHEFTHMVSIQKTIKSSLTFPYGFVQWFAYEKERRRDVVRGFPNLLVSYPVSSVNMPVWFAEGTAQYQNNHARYDYRDPHREMILRDRVLHKRLLSLNAMSVFGKNSHGNESSYNQGFSLVKYIARRFGEKVLSKITERNSHWSSYTFDSAVEEATGHSLQSLYNDWRDSLTVRYTDMTATIRRHIVAGKKIENDGFANLYPVFSPDGRRVAWVSNKGRDYFGQTRIVIWDSVRDKKEELPVAGVNSSLSWSPDGRYLVYTRQARNRYMSGFNDLYVWDMDNREEHRLSYGLRGRNPSFSPDGRAIAFVSATDGLHALNVLRLSAKGPLDGTWLEDAFDMTTGELLHHKADTLTQRPVKVLGEKLEQLLFFTDARQIYHPRWRPDARQLIFGTSTDFGRHIGVYDFDTGQFRVVRRAREELRYPVYSPDGAWLYFASSATGIYNIYRAPAAGGTPQLLTNVTGGAFMPTVNRDGRLVYALYDSVGYKLAVLDDPRPIDPTNAVYDTRYPASVPVKDFDDIQTPTYKTRPYQTTFSRTQILPRLFIDYGTVKPGFYITKSDVLDQLYLVAGAAVNSDLEYDLYAYASYNKLLPSLWLEFFNSSANIRDTLELDRGYVVKGVRKVGFNLVQFSAGATFIPWEKTHLTISYTGSRYSAQLDPLTLKTPTDGELYVPTIRYDYLRGHAVHLKLIMDRLGQNRFAAVNPSSGYYLYARYGFEINNFLEGFATDRQLGLEEFKRYIFNSLDVNAEVYFENPLWAQHAVGLSVKTGFIDRPVAGFFNYFAGGLIGLRGYPFYSMEGRHKLIGTLTYRFPISRGLDWRLGHLRFDKLFAGFFAEAGNAFDENRIDFSAFKKDVGLELRLDTFSYNMFPTRVFVQAAYPLDVARNGTVSYPREWRFYGGILFDFDLRERLTRGIPR